MGRAPKTDDEKREGRVLLKLSAADLATIDAKADAANATRNEYIVARAVGRKPKPRKSPKGTHARKAE